jgi:hypothetical protein
MGHTMQGLGTRIPITRKRTPRSELLEVTNWRVPAAQPWTGSPIAYRSTAGLSLLLAVACISPAWADITPGGLTLILYGVLLVELPYILAAMFAAGLLSLFIIAMLLKVVQKRRKKLISGPSEPAPAENPVTGIPFSPIEPENLLAIQPELTRPEVDPAANPL